ncbi:MAG TPA: hypothetical protein VE914_09845 [Candidatus Angelobacter sp.]|nr:hypothetical protein [Candidatus Angelobacter sp.]
MDETAVSIWSRVFNFGDPLGAELFRFLGLTVVVFGGAAAVMGRALADTWRPSWQNVAYGLLLAIANRLFQNFLFANDVLNLVAYGVGAAVLIGLALLAYRATQAHKMVAQYPWLYERSGAFTWRELS